MKKYITFSASIKEKLDNDKKITHKLKFIDSFRFMPTSLSSLVYNLSEINKEECKACMKEENVKPQCEFIGIKNNNLRYKFK